MREKELAKEYLELSEVYHKSGDIELAQIAFITHKYYQKIYHQKTIAGIKKSA